MDQGFFFFDDLLAKYRYLHILYMYVVLGNEPAGPTVHPPPQNDREWVNFFRIGV